MYALVSILLEEKLSESVVKRKTVWWRCSEYLQVCSGGQVQDKSVAGARPLILRGLCRNNHVDLLGSQAFAKQQYSRFGLFYYSTP